jgi:N-ethylmaleimide reductase
MPPMTRSRAADGNVATAEMAAYYAQRASAGLIVSEGTQISRRARAMPGPRHPQPEQVQGWRQVTDAVHAAGGRIYAQLWHVGRSRMWPCSRVAPRRCRRRRCWPKA